MITKIETITPEYAAEELKRQEDRIAKGVYSQRRINDETVAKYVADMKAGFWLVNNQGIGFDVEGNLLDGRHRLWAIKLAGVPVDMLVVRGLPISHKNGALIKTVDTIDTGRARKMAQQLQIDGVVNANNIAAAVRVIYTLSCNLNRRVKATTFQVRRILSIFNPTLPEIVKTLMHSKEAVGPLSGCVALYTLEYPRKGNAFLKSYTEMVGLPAGSPIIALKRFLAQHYGWGGDTLTDRINAVTLALRHYHEETPVTNLRQSRIGSDWLLKAASEPTEKVRKIMDFKLAQETQKERREK